MMYEGKNQYYEQDKVNAKCNRQELVKKKVFILTAWWLEYVILLTVYRAETVSKVVHKAVQIFRLLIDKT